MEKADTRQIVLLAHGSRDARWCKTFETGLKTINGYLDSPACLAYMEMASPGLETVIANKYLRGIRDIDVLPLFFAEGKHLLHDVPKIIARLEQNYSELQIRLLPAVGRQEAFWEALGMMISTTQPAQFDQQNMTDDDSQRASEKQH